MSRYEENAWVLNDLASKGRNLEPPRLVDFEHLFPDQISAQNFADEAKREGFIVRVWESMQELEDTDEGKSIEEPDSWTWNATASKVMVPTCENITETEERLGAIAQRHDGYSDGWGFFDP